MIPRLRPEAQHRQAPERLCREAAGPGILCQPPQDLRRLRRFRRVPLKNRAIKTWTRGMGRGNWDLGVPLRRDYSIHLNIATCKWWLPLLVLKKQHVSNGCKMYLLRRTLISRKLLAAAASYVSGGGGWTRLAQRSGDGVKGNQKTFERENPVTTAHGFPKPGGVGEGGAMEGK